MVKEILVADEEQLKRLKQGVEIWNAWRKSNPETAINFSGVNLNKVILKKANLRGANLSRAMLQNSHLGGTDLSGADLSAANLNGAFLWGANLGESDLWKANLKGANLNTVNLSEAFLGEVNLSNATLCRAQALDTDFTGANLTGACIEDWNINSETKLDDVQCEYIYLKYPDQERRPSDPNRNFEPGEFTKLFQKALNTVDLIFRNGVDWQALLISLEKLRVEAAGAELSIQAIENKENGAFVVRVNTPPGADKAEVEKFLQREYEVAVKTLEAKYESQLHLQGEQLAFYREELATKRQDNTRLMGVIEIMAENQAPKYDMRGSTFGNFVDTAQTGSQQSATQFITMSQDLTQAAAQIQELLNQLQKTGVTVEVAQEQVATDLANQATSNPTVMGKLVGWGQAMATKAGETTISEAAKAIVPLALKLVGIPLP